MEPTIRSNVRYGGVIVLGLGLICQGQAAAQVKGVPKAAAPGPSSSMTQPTVVPAPSEELPDTSVAPAAGPITLENPVKDSDIRQALEHLLPKYPGVRSITAEVDRGAVTLEGQAENEEIKAGVTQFTQKVEGVRLVLNRMKTDAQVLTPLQAGGQAVGRLWQSISRNWVDVLLALVYVLVFLALAGVSEPIPRLCWRPSSRTSCCGPWPARS